MKKIEVVSYDSSWPQKFEIEENHIKNFLKHHALALHHIGSTSIKGLAAKKDIDILLIVTDLQKSLLLKEIGYVFKGELNIPLRYFFSKKSEDSKVNLHVVEPDHGFIALNLAFRDYLRKHPESCREYEKLKFEILKDPKNHEKMPSGHSTRYGTQKDQFIKKILEKAGFEEWIVNLCHHEAEWKAFKQLLGQHPDSRTYSLVLYKGTQIVAAAKTSLTKEIIQIATSKNNLTAIKELESFINKWRFYLNKCL